MNTKIQNGENNKFYLAVGKHCYAKLKMYSAISGYTIKSIVEMSVEEFLSKKEWDEITSNYILDKFDNQE